MAADIAKETRIEAELIEGGGGVFDVVVDDELVFSKHAEDRFPEHQEVIDSILSKS